MLPKHVPAPVWVSLLYTCVLLGCDNPEGHTPAPITQHTEGWQPAWAEEDEVVSAEQKAVWRDRLDDGGDFVEVKLRPGVQLVPQAVADVAFVEQGALRFPAQGNEDLLSLAEGTPMVADRASDDAAGNPLGFMRKVKSVQQIGDEIVIETERAALSEIITGAAVISEESFLDEELEISDEALLDLAAGLTMADEKLPHISLAELESAGPNTIFGGFGGGGWGFGGGGFGFGGLGFGGFGFGGLDFIDRGVSWAKERLKRLIDIEFEIHSGISVRKRGDFAFQKAMEKEKEAGGITFTAEGVLTIGGTYDISLKPRFGVIVDESDFDEVYAKFNLKGGLFLDALLELVFTADAGGRDEFEQFSAAERAAEAQVEAEDGWRRTLATKKWKGPMLGPVPTTFVLEMLQICTLEAEATLTAEANVRTDVDFEMGARWRKGDGWDPTYDLNWNFGHTFEMEVAGGAMLSCTLGPRLSWLIADTAGPFAEANLGGRADLVYQETCGHPYDQLQTKWSDGFINSDFTITGDVLVGVTGEVCPFKAAQLDKLGVDDLCFDLGDTSWPIYDYEKLVMNRHYDLPQGLGVCQGLCDNFELDPDVETDVDCGGRCGTTLGFRCDVGQRCEEHIDCDDFLMCEAGRCVETGCGNERLDEATESDVDCGGLCMIFAQACNEGERCNVFNDCADGLYCAEGGTCEQMQCDSGAKDAGESDTDCGGPCALGLGQVCPDGAGCRVDTDCSPASACLRGGPQIGICVPRSCDPEVVPVGRPTPQRAEDLSGFNPRVQPYSLVACNVCEGVDTPEGYEGGCVKTRMARAADLGGRLEVLRCGAEAFTCPAGAEICGADIYATTRQSSAPRALNVACGCVDDDGCQSGQCVDFQCTPGLCENERLNLGEGDIDCGGECSARCAVQSTCNVDDDCDQASAYGALTCAAPNGGEAMCTQTCFNGVADAGEADVDCGGPCARTCGEDALCTEQADCSAGLICAARTEGDPTQCLGPCFNGAVDAGETGVDCGGTCDAQCALGAGCVDASDCASGFCDGAQCVESCADGQQSPGEVGVDCGGICDALCPSGSVCGADDDCATGYCTPQSTCGTPTCADGWANGGETDVDCGGTCDAQCPEGAQCGDADDCTTGICQAGRCVLGGCLNGERDGDETDVDCGGSCGPCPLDRACGGDGDCQSNQCIDGTCQFQPCVDGQVSPGESDVDCGRGCDTRCGLDQACFRGEDCDSGVCSAAGRCVASTCADGRWNAGEADIDCGGDCEQTCEFGQRCLADRDCRVGVCGPEGTCTEACRDGVLSPGETDIDCGGDCAQACALEGGCADDADCQSGHCNGTVCVASACENGRQDAGEGGVDCGGECNPCATGAGCVSDGDCASGICSANGQCVNNTCENGVRDVGARAEVGVDCGGFCPFLCGDGQPCEANSQCASGFCDDTCKQACNCAVGQFTPEWGTWSCAAHTNFSIEEWNFSNGLCRYHTRPEEALANPPSTCPDHHVLVGLQTHHNYINSDSPEGGYVFGMLWLEALCAPVQVGVDGAVTLGEPTAHIPSRITTSLAPYQDENNYVSVHFDPIPRRMQCPEGYAVRGINARSPYYAMEIDSVSCGRVNALGRVDTAAGFVTINHPAGPVPFTSPNDDLRGNMRPTCAGDGLIYAIDWYVDESVQTLDGREQPLMSAVNDFSFRCAQLTPTPACLASDRCVSGGQ
ncbi:MAG: hypothetical protein ACE366_00060 [Bradymonadia bacterium]